MITMAQSAANWRNTHTRVDRTYSLTHFTSTQLQPPGAKRQLSYYIIWNIFFLKVPEGRGANRSTRFTWYKCENQRCFEVSYALWKACLFCIDNSSGCPFKYRYTIADSAQLTQERKTSSSAEHTGISARHFESVSINTSLPFCTPPAKLTS